MAFASPLPVMKVEPKFVKWSPEVCLADQALLLQRMEVENEL